jgi:putative ABC transport system ATP-binding protein
MTIAGQRLFENLNFDLQSGEVSAIVGPSGSGKTTLLSILAGYQRPVAGSISFIDAAGTPSNADPTIVTWIPQSSNALFRRTARENIAIAPLSEGKSLEESFRLADRLLEVVGLNEKAERQARRLSGGELQRLAFARALASSRPLIFADEPSANLDAANTRLIARLLDELRSEKTIVVATHDPVLFESSTNVVALR